MKTQVKDNDLQTYTFLSHGTMLYFEQDKQFLYFIKEQTPHLMEKMQYARQSKTPYTIYPYEVTVAILRKNVTEETIGKYFKEEILRFSGTSTEFLAKYFDTPYYLRHCKTKGTMQLTDYIVKTWQRYYGTKKNTSVFAISELGKKELTEEPKP